MMLHCDNVQLRLTDAPTELNPVEREHIESCEACAAYASALNAIDGALGVLPDHDAPDETVTALLLAVRSDAADLRASNPPASYEQRRLLWKVTAWVAPIAAVVLVVAVSSMTMMTARMNAPAPLPPKVIVESPAVKTEDTKDVLQPEGGAAADGTMHWRQALKKPDDTKRPVSGTETPDQTAAFDVGLDGVALDSVGLDRAVGGKDGDKSGAVAQRADNLRAQLGDTEGEGDRFAQTIVTGEVAQLERRNTASNKPEKASDDLGGHEGKKGEGKGRFELSEFGEFSEVADEFRGEAQVQLPAGEDKEVERNNLAFNLKSQVSTPKEIDARQVDMPNKAGANNELVVTKGLAANRRVTAGDRWLTGRDVVDGLTFVDPHGYWSNTYVPGDPQMRVLQSRLTPLGVELSKRATPFSRPFDAPRSAAMAVYLASDRRQIRGQTRAIVQVGLQASKRRGGRRPAMNVGVVLDLTDVQPDTHSALRAVVTELGRHRQAADTFFVTVAGKPGGVVVPASAFKHGPLTVAMTRLLTGKPYAGDTMDLATATIGSLARVRTEAADGSPLGASQVVVITSRRLSDDLVSDLGRIAHRGAVEGISVSTIGVGHRVDPTQLDRIALAGQGRRRVLSDAAGARALVGEELAAVARVVARALRVRVRLAPGVQLVEVIGAPRLGATDVARAKATERSIDQRLDRDLAIKSDRNDDEDGIQILIPAFYAGDSHVILLDVVVEGPGPIADVRVRFKDLVRLENGVARDSLTFVEGDGARSPLERHVLKSLVEYQTAALMREAGQRTQSGDIGGANERLARAIELVESIGAGVPGWSKDTELSREAGLLRAFRQALGTARGDAAHRKAVADALNYAGRKKLVSRTLSD